MTPRAMADYNPPGPVNFATTHWSVVKNAHGSGEGAKRALSTLCKAYWYPLYFHVRRRGYSAQDAQDLTQDFFANLFTKGWLDRVAPGHGKFRSWLLAAMNHFLCNAWDRERSIKRGGQVKFISMDELQAEKRFHQEPASADSPELAYDRAWALTLLERVMARMRAEFASAGKLTLFETIKGTLTGDAPTQASMAESLGTTEGAVKVAVHRLRERFRTTIREEIAETVSSNEEVEEEMRRLREVLFA